MVFGQHRKHRTGGRNGDHSEYQQIGGAERACAGRQQGEEQRRALQQGGAAQHEQQHRDHAHGGHFVAREKREYDQAHEAAVPGKQVGTDQFAQGQIARAQHRHALQIPGARTKLLGDRFGRLTQAPEMREQQIDRKRAAGHDRTAGFVEHTQKQQQAQYHRHHHQSHRRHFQPGQATQFGIVEEAHWTTLRSLRDVLPEGGALLNSALPSGVRADALMSAP